MNIESLNFLNISSGGFFKNSFIWEKIKNTKKSKLMGVLYCTHAGKL